MSTALLCQNPACGREFFATNGAAADIFCPHCGFPTGRTADPLASGTIELSVLPTATPPGLRCPACGHDFPVEDPGAVVSCPECGFGAGRVTDGDSSGGSWHPPPPDPEGVAAAVLVAASADEPAAVPIADALARPASLLSGAGGGSGRVVCPNPLCRQTFVPPGGADVIFCPACGIGAGGQSTARYGPAVGPVVLRCPNPYCLRDERVAAGVPAPPHCPACGEPFPDQPAPTPHDPAAESSLPPDAVATLGPDPGPTPTITGVPRLLVNLPRRLGPGAATAPALPLQPEVVRLGRFRVRRRVGAGAFGVVYLAYDPHLDREVALKVPTRQTAADLTRMARFLREARAAANLRHPNIVPVYDAGRDGDRYFIAAAFIDGKPLNEAVPEGGMDFRTAAGLVKELAEALAYAHGQGIVHRDVKPHNCMLDRKGHLHLMDFGLARRGDDAQDAGGSATASRDSRLTNDGVMMGTPAYMAPEQARGRVSEVGPAADQYAAGVVLYQLLTGKTPFAGSPEVVVYNLLHRDPDPPSKLRRGVPRDLETICRKAMAKKPSGRYASCQKLADDLRRWLDGEPAAARELNEFEAAARWLLRRPTAAAVTLLGLVVGGLIVSLSIAGGVAEKAKRERDFAVAEWEGGRAALARQRADLLDEQARVAADRGRAGAELAALDRTRTPTRQASAELYARVLATMGTNGLPRSLADAVPPELRGWEWHRARQPRNHPAPAEPVCTLAGHGGPVRAAAVSPDGQWVATGADDNTARVWDAATGRERVALRGHTGPVRAVAFSPDGSRVVTGSGDGTARVWDAATGKWLANYNGHAAGVGAAAVSPDGAWVATGGDNGTVHVWEAAAGKPVAVHTGHTGAVRTVGFRPDGARVVSAGSDNLTRLGTAQTGGAAAAIKWHPSTGTVVAAGYRGVSDRVLLVDANGAVRVGSTATGLAGPALRGEGRPTEASAFGSLGGVAATADADGAVRVWDLDAGRVAVAFRLAARPTAVALSADGTRAVVAADGTVGVWDVAGIRARSAAFSADSGQVVVTTPGGELKAFRVPTLVADPATPAAAPPRLPATPDKARVLVIADDKAVVRETVSGVDVYTLPQSDVADASFSPDGHWIVTVGKDSRLRLYDGRPEGAAKAP